MKLATPYFAIKFCKMKKMERLHSHKRDAIVFIFGTVREQHNGISRNVFGFNIVPSERRHRVATNGNTYALTISGPLKEEYCNA